MDQVTKTSAESRVESASVPSYEEKKNIREKRLSFRTFHTIPRNLVFPQNLKGNNRKFSFLSFFLSAPDNGLFWKERLLWSQRSRPREEDDGEGSQVAPSSFRKVQTENKDLHRRHVPDGDGSGAPPPNHHGPR